jgi:hypothetical protein
VQEQRLLTAAAAAALLALSSCGGCDRVPDQAQLRCGQSLAIPAVVETDILFVVDDSGSMAAEQSRLATAFGSFITALGATPVQNDYQIGITTTSVDYPVCSVALDASGNCPGTVDVQTTFGGSPSGVPYPRGALVAAGSRPKLLRKGSPTLVADFVANVAVGTSGSGKEQGLRALRYALEDRILDGTNAGLLRPGARLAIVLVSDEDDCSEFASPPRIVYRGADRCHSDAEQALLPPVQQFADFLRSPIGGEARDVTLAVVAGVNPVSKLPEIPACNPGGYKAVRYKQLTDAFGAAGYIDDVCQPDFTATLNAIASLIDPGQNLPLSGTPPDWRLLQVMVSQADGAQSTCSVGLAGSTADVLYREPQGGRPASLTFQGAPGQPCRLGPGVSVQIKIVCAG